MKRSNEIKMAIRLKEVEKGGLQRIVQKRVMIINRQIAKLNRELEAIRAGDKDDLEIP